MDSDCTDVIRRRGFPGRGPGLGCLDSVAHGVDQQLADRVTDRLEDLAIHGDLVTDQLEADLLSQFAVLAHPPENGTFLVLELGEAAERIVGGQVEHGQLTFPGQHGRLAPGGAVEAHVGLK